jgi:glycosyltransferase involved in cell wall biosynthesis
MLSNYELLLRSKLGGKFRTAFWGHGRNLRPSENQKTTEWFKTKFSTHVDWWFAYNDFSANIVRDLGYPNERITNVRNSIDTTTLMSAHDSVKPAALESLRVAMGITSTNVAVYTGGLTEQKRIGFLLESAVLVRRLVPDFHLIILGDGPLSEEVGAIASTHDWIHYEGAKHDTEKVPYWALSKLLLMPGGVGLVVLDSFALGIPMVTTENRFHGPEIEYLKDGVNGLMVKPGDDPEHYAAEVAALLRDDARREAMAAAALVERDRYSSEDMAQRFATGIMQALDAPRYRVFF